jgi:hypothetical protein
MKRIYESSRIRSVTAEGLTYLDDNDKEQFIDFAQCFERHLAERLSPKTWEKHKKSNDLADSDWDKYQKHEKMFKYVGRRNIVTEPDGAFIEFFTHPPTRFKFSSTDECHQTLDKVRQGRWRAIDLS